MLNNGIRYFVDAKPGENIVKFAIELVEFRKTINIDIIAKFNDLYIDVNDQMTSEDIIKQYYKLLGGNKNE